MSKENKKKYAGFTLIELMVVIAIIGIMTVISVASLVKGRDQKMTEAEGRKVAAAVREMQNDALTGKGAGGCGFTFTYGSSSYKITGCVTVNYVTGGGVTFSNASNAAFSIANGQVPWATFSLAINPTKILLQKGSAKTYICVYQPGNVIENGASQNCP